MSADKEVDELFEDSQLDDLFGDNEESVGSLGPIPQSPSQQSSTPANVLFETLFDDEETNEMSMTQPAKRIKIEVKEELENTQPRGNLLEDRIKSEIGSPTRDQQLSPRSARSDTFSQTNVMSRDDDMRDYFGDFEDMEESRMGSRAPEVDPRTTAERQIRKRLLPDGETFLFRIPNTLAMEMEPYHPDQISINQGYSEDNGKLRLSGPESTIRYRYQYDENGQIMKDEMNEPVFESNAKFIEWEDGSIMLQVGEELYNCTNPGDGGRTHLYVEEDEDVYVFHKPLTKTMQLTPVDKSAKAHERLKSAQLNKVRNPRGLKPISETQARGFTQISDKAYEASNIRALGEKPWNKAKKGMDANYLEADDDAQGPSLKDIKKNAARDSGFLNRVARAVHKQN